MDGKPTEEDIREFEELKLQLEERYYTAVGKGISAWSETEGLLVNIAGVLLETKFEKAGLVFYSIMNFHSWLSIIDELFEMDPRYQHLRSDWTKIAERLRKLNDTRVRLAHHAIDRGKRFESLTGDDDVELLFPSLKPNPNDVRIKSRKQSPLQLEHLAGFMEELGPICEKLTALFRQMTPIWLEPKQRLMRKVQELSRKAGDLQTQELTDKAIQAISDKMSK